MEKIKKQFSGLFFIICAVFLVLQFCSCDESWKQRHINQRQKQVNNDCLKKRIMKTDLPDSLKKEVCGMSYETYLNENPLIRETKRLNLLSKKEQQKCDTMFAYLYASKEEELSKEAEKYRDKSKILRIKRLWMNSDVTPWTYQSWLAVSYQMSGRSIRSMFSSVGSFSGNIKPNMSGSAEYKGEYKIDYINVVFSDNSFRQFKVKDNPEWLLAKVGDKVKLCYIIKNYDSRLDACKVLEKGAYDIVIDTKYIPLFK